MVKKSYKKEKRETFGKKFVNLLLTLLLACIISSQVCPAANNNLRFAQISDAHFSTTEANTSYKLLKKSSDLLDDSIFQLNTSGPYDFVVFTGDLINKPVSSELDKFLVHLKKLNYKWCAVNGNHDVAIGGELSKKAFRTKINAGGTSYKSDKPYFAFTPKKGFRVICLDAIIDTKVTTNGELPKDEFDWFKEELDTHRDEVIVVCTHIPIDEPFSSPSHRMYNEYDVKRLLKDYNNPIIVLQGHYHCAKAKQNGNIIYITTPSLVSFPNAFRVVNINRNKNRTMVDVFLKETNLKETQSHARIRVLGTDILYGAEEDRNTSFEIKNNKE